MGEGPSRHNGDGDEEAEERPRGHGTSHGNDADGDALEEGDAGARDSGSGSDTDGSDAGGGSSPPRRKRLRRLRDDVSGDDLSGDLLSGDEAPLAAPQLPWPLARALASAGIGVAGAAGAAGLQLPAADARLLAEEWAGSPRRARARLFALLFALEEARPCPPPPLLPLSVSLPPL